MHTHTKTQDPTICCKQETHLNWQSTSEPYVNVVLYAINISPIVLNNTLKFSFGHWYIAGCRFVTYGCHCIEVCSFYSRFLWGFYHENILYSSKGLSASNEILVITGQMATYVLSYTYWFVYIEPSLCYCNEINLVMVYDIPNLFLNLI